MKRITGALRALFGRRDGPQLPYEPAEAAIKAAAAQVGEADEIVIRWTQRTAYLFIESDEQGALVHTNLPETLCPRCKVLVTDAGIDTGEFATHRCGNKSGRR